MARMIDISLSGFQRSVEAILLDDREPDYAEHLWQLLETPLRMWSWHPMMTGDWFACKARPLARKAPPLQSRTPKTSRLMCDIEAGSIMYAADRMLRFAYGPSITEPLAGHRPVVARAVDADVCFAAGRHVLMSQFGTHELVTVTVTRRDA